MESQTHRNDYISKYQLQEFFYKTSREVARAIFPQVVGTEHALEMNRKLCNPVWAAFWSF
jgi:hypothetical protein